MAARIVLTILVALLVGTGSAFADSCTTPGVDCTYDLNVANSTTALGSLSSYGTVELKLDTTTGLIKFIVDLAPGYTLFGNTRAFGFNSSINPDPTPLSLSAATSGYGPTSISSGSTQFDGFGNFEYNVIGPVPPSAGQNLVTFTIGLPSGNFTSINQLVELSSGGSNVDAFFAAQIFNSACTGAACTGFVGATGTAVPEPSSYAWLMGAAFGLIVLVFERRRRRTA